MSFDFNYKLWVATKNDLKHLIKRQNELKRWISIEDPLLAFKIVSQLYILYAELVSKLAYLYNVTSQVQKKAGILQIIEPALDHLMELKTQLKSIEMSEFVYLDKFLVERKITPYNVLIWRSPDFIYTRPPEFQAQLFDFQQIQDLINNEKNNKIYTQEIITIQSHERARQARMYKYAIEHNKNKLKIRTVSQNKYIFNNKCDQSLIAVKRTHFATNFIKSSAKCTDIVNKGIHQDIQKDNDSYVNKIKEKSAFKIQKAWKNYKESKNLKAQKSLREFLYGMRKKKKLTTPNENERILLKSYQNSLRQIALDKDFVSLMKDERTRLLQEYQPQIMEDISDHIREWFRQFHEATNDFHPYPEVLKSGTILVLTDESMNFEEFKNYQAEQNMSKEEKKKLKEKQNMLKKKEKEKLKKEKLKELKKLKKIADSGAYNIKYEMEHNNNIENLTNAISQFSIDWQNVDEYLNKHEEPIKEWVTERELATIHKELRGLIDGYMRIEYDLLKAAWAIDNNKEYKPKPSKPSKPKEKKKKIPFDMTADRSIESLYQELKTAEIIENIPRKYFDNFIGDFNFLADQLRDKNNQLTESPAKADIKMAIQDMLFGMGKFNIHKPKGLCLVGPKNNGKKLLCQIIASELGALLINISPEKTCKLSENLKYYLHVIMKVAKALQPTVLFIEDAHRVFYKKVPKEQMDIQPTLFEKPLVKTIIKSLKKDDKIMILGTSDLPWVTNINFKKVFQNILLVPASNYGSILLLWLNLLTQNIQHDYFEDSMLSVLAKLFQKYNTGDISDNVAETLNIRRRMQLHSIALKPQEFLEYFINRPTPIFSLDEKHDLKYKTWYSKINNFAKKVKKADKKKKKK